MTEPLDTPRSEDQLPTSAPMHSGRLPDEQWKKADSSIFLLLHALPLLAFFTGAPLRAWIMCAVLYVVRMFFITAGYHRYFAHRSYKTKDGSMRYITEVVLSDFQLLPNSAEAAA